MHEAVLRPWNSLTDDPSAVGTTEDVPRRVVRRI